MSRKLARRAFALGIVVATIAGITPGSTSGTEYSAIVRRTEYGIPHIKGNSYGDVAFGLGYAFAEDNICVMADTFVTVNAQRSIYFGPDATYRSEANGVVPRNLDSDFFYQWINESGVIEQLVDGTHPSGTPPLSEGLKSMTTGWVAGYNQYLADIGGAAGIQDPTCAGADWVRPITDLDLYRRFYQLIMFASKGALLPYIVGATPPPPDLGPFVPDKSKVDVTKIPSADNLALGSNAYALGPEATVSGNGMLLGNPHFPWRGPERFYEFHLTIPDVMNVSGGALFGSPLVHIGFNEHIAWSHTVSVPFRFTTYELKLVPGFPTKYIHEGQILDMEETTVEVMVPDGDGLKAVQHTFYESMFGPVMDFTDALMPWTPATAYSFIDANEDNFRALEHFFEVNQADSSAEVESILMDLVGIPWVNTLVADDTGDALYGDVSVVPHITDDQITQCTVPVGLILEELARLPVLDGTRADCMPGTDPEAPVPGIYGGPSLPRLHRDDYVANSNDSFWLSNPEEPLEGYPYVMGSERTERSLRTRLGIRMIQQRLDGSDGMGDAGFTLEKLQGIVFNNRQYAAELVIDDLVSRVCVVPVGVSSSGTVVDLTEACEVLADWDRTVNLDARGAVIFREFMRFGYPGDGPFFLQPFDAEDPVNTPNTLDFANPEIRVALADAVERLNEAGVALDTPLGEVQRARRNGESIPIHGGFEAGIFNYINAPWVEAEAGYPDTTYGSSFVLTAELTPEGPNAYGILTYSISTDPTSPHFGDQTELYSSKTWVKMLFTEDEVATNKIDEYVVEG